MNPATPTRPRTQNGHPVHYQSPDVRPLASKKELVDMLRTVSAGASPLDACKRLSNTNPTLWPDAMEKYEP